MRCQKCGEELSAYASYCLSCGEMIVLTEASAVDNRQLQPMIQQEEEYDPEYIFVSENQAYYFSKWEQRFSWNWASFFLGILWFGYRRMYVTICLILVLYMMISLSFLFLNTSLPVLNVLGLTVLVNWAIGSQGNLIYRKHMKQKLKKIQEVGYSKQEERLRIELAGGTSLLGVLGAIGLQIVANILFEIIAFAILT